MEIHGLNKTTLLDYPEHVACTVFTGHCNFRCPFCHNGDLVLNPSGQPQISEEEFFNFLNKRREMLDGVAITGGEPTLQKDLPEFIARIKDIGLSVKLDTNGAKPDILIKLVESGLVDYVAMDIKASLPSYPRVTGLKSIDINAVSQSVQYLLDGHIPYEFRTTVVKELHDMAEFEGIAGLIKGCSDYYLQGYKDSDALLLHMMPPEFANEYKGGFSSYIPSELEAIKRKLISLGVNAHLRGIE